MEITEYITKKRFHDDVVKALNKGLDKAAERLLKEYENSPLTPNDTKTKGNQYKKSFAVNQKYKNARYVGNTKTVKYNGRDVPLSNILEYSENGKPHIVKIYESIEDELTAIISNIIVSNI